MNKIKKRRKMDVVDFLKTITKSNAFSDVIPVCRWETKVTMFSREFFYGLHNVQEVPVSREWTVFRVQMNLIKHIEILILR